MEKPRGPKGKGWGGNREQSFVPTRFSCARLCVTPWTAARQAHLSMRFSRQEYWSGLPCTPPGDLPDPGIEPGSRALQADSSPLSHQGSPVRCCSSLKSQNSLEGDSTVCQGIQKGGASPEHLADL